MITLSDLFVFEVAESTPSGPIAGTLRATGVRPKLTERLHDAGIELPGDLFDTTT